jgi:transcriptional regulator with XRE-family HTH domain
MPSQVGKLDPTTRLSQPDLTYIPDMGLREQMDSYFGERVRKEREQRRWSQEELAKRMTDKGIPVYASTIAKIESEKKPRPARLGEAVVIAELFEVPVSALLGRQPDDTTLTFAMTILLGYIQDAEGQILQAQRTATDIEEQLDDVGERFDSPHIEVLRRTALDMAGHLDKAQALATELVHTASQVIADAGRKT